MKTANKTVFDPGMIMASLHCKDPRMEWDDISPTPEKQSAVLVPFFSKKGVAHILVVERSFSLRRHPGQIAFPGGAREGSDRGPAETALREFEEETGISSDRIDLIGILPEERAYTSDFVLFPVVGFIRSEFSLAGLTPDPVEVKRLIEIPLHALAKDPVMEEFSRGGEPLSYPVFVIGDIRIWGATAWIIHRMIRSLSEGPGSSLCPL